jgi:hypothetical protein
MAGGIAKIIGKLQGKISAGALKQTSEIADKLRVSGCPTPGQLDRLKNKSQNLNSSISKIDRRLDKFRRIPKKLKTPVSALKKIIKIIKLLPIPQSIPPGFGLPVNLTVKYSDILVKLQEFIQQIDEIIVSIETALDVPSSSLSSIKNILSRTDSAVSACQVSSQLQQDLENGNLTEAQLADAGLLEDDGTTIFSNLGPLFLGNSTVGGDGELTDSKKLATDKDIEDGKTNPNSSNYDSSLLVAGTGSGTDGRFTDADLNGPSSDIDKAIKKLSEGFDKLQDSNLDSSVKDSIRKLLSTLEGLGGAGTGDGTGEDGTGGAGIRYTAANGITYLLEIRNDPNSPSIAPKRFGVALTLDEGVAVLKSQPSFSSDTNVLLDEVKFRLDNQLP